MTRDLIKGSVFLFLFMFSFSAFSEVNFSPSENKMEAILSGKVVASLEEGNTEGTVDDSTGGKFNVQYDPSGKKLDVSAVSGSSSITFGIATIFLEEGTSFAINYEGHSIIKVKNTSPDKPLLIVFPDGSRIEVAADAEISLTMMADLMWHLKVLTGTVVYTDPRGHDYTVTSTNPAIVVKGFTKTPWWRKLDTEKSFPDWKKDDDHPATP